MGEPHKSKYNTANLNGAFVLHSSLCNIINDFRTIGYTNSAYTVEKETQLYCSVPAPLIQVENIINHFLPDFAGYLQLKLSDKKHCSVIKQESKNNKKSASVR